MLYPLLTLTTADRTTPNKRARDAGRLHIADSGVCGGG
jgi:hypothetical protein